MNADLGDDGLRPQPCFAAYLGEIVSFGVSVMISILDVAAIGNDVSQETLSVPSCACSQSIKIVLAN
jgi:hypothetical protein